MSTRILAILILAASLLSSATAFELKNGDKVAFLGDTFIERMQYHGWLELAATTRFPDRDISFINLGWSADTPGGASRNGLSLLQAGHAPAGEGWRQLQNQLRTYRPTVIILGYGMASSLPGGQSPAEFQDELTRLLREAPTLAGHPVRFLILSTPPLIPATGQNPAHQQRLAAINTILKETATAHQYPFIDLTTLPQDPAYTQNSIHLTSQGYQALARHIEKALGWPTGPWDQGKRAENLRQHILKKNQWFFNRSRPANMAYIFGFRKKEQGQNAGEIPQFDQLIAAQETHIARLRDLSQDSTIPLPPVRTKSAVAANTPQPAPTFTVADGYEVTLWAENPLLHKPTQMNFDAQGRLWVASSQTYPQIEVGQTPDDQIIILEDRDRDGKAEHSHVFADGFLMPTGILPGNGGAYVAQSTDLFHLADTDGDGKADTRTRLLSGFGTEDTHHNLHTLRRGPDGRLWMNQSIYTRSDIETPHGLTRLKSGGIMRFDPHTHHLTPTFYGWCNPWGHQFDKYGQSFVTDGAGGQGINWAVPGAMYFTYAKAPKTLRSISPGSYPKFCGLEIIESPHFPADWQGSMVTCDFRAHRVVRFSINDQDSAYTAQAEEDLLRTNNVNFRPIDVKIGPDGALYIADWSNPIINHGEVDFRDPRRDRAHGRIWRLTKKSTPLTKVTDLTTLPPAELLPKLTSPHRHEREQATALLFEAPDTPELTAAIASWQKNLTTDHQKLAALWLAQSRNNTDPSLLQQTLRSDQGEIRAAAIRVLGHWLHLLPTDLTRPLLHTHITDPHPRVRLETIRVLAKIPTAQALDTALTALTHPRDPFIDYALWLNTREHGQTWLKSVMSGQLGADKRTTQLQFVLAELPPAEATAAITKLLPDPLPKDGTGPWLDLALKNGDAAILTRIFHQITQGGFDQKTTQRALTGISQALSQRQITPRIDPQALLRLLQEHPSPPLLTLAGQLAQKETLPRLRELAANPTTPGKLRLPATQALRSDPSPQTRDLLLTLARNHENPAELRQSALLTLAHHHRQSALPHLAELAQTLSDPTATRHFWQQTLALKGLSTDLAAHYQKHPLTPALADRTLQYIPDIAEHDALLKLLRTTAGQLKYTPADYQNMALAAQKHGDPARGEHIYRRPALACTACHAIGGAGGKVGPDLTSLGASAPLDYLIESILDPGAKVKEGYHSIIIETKDGQSLIGQQIRADADSLTLRDATNREKTIPLSHITKKTDAGSSMPANLISSLTPQEKNDLYKFLSQLGKPGPFDATKSHSPKTWAALRLNPAIQEKATRADPSLPWQTLLTTVDGRLLPADLTPIAPPGADLILATRLQLAQAATIQLTFTGGATPTAIWINGQPANNGQATLPPGQHHITLRLKHNKQPLKATTTHGTFLPEW